MNLSPAPPALRYAWVVRLGSLLLLLGLAACGGTDEGGTKFENTGGAAGASSGGMAGSSVAGQSGSSGVAGDLVGGTAGASSGGTAGDAGTACELPPSASGVTCDATCTAPSGYADGGPSGLCPVPAGGGQCTNVQPLTADSPIGEPSDESVILPALDCVLKYAVAVGVGQCARLTESVVATWGFSESPTLPGGSARCLVVTGSKTVYAWSYGPQSGSWFRVEWHPLTVDGGACDLQCPAV